LEKEAVFSFTKEKEIGGRKTIGVEVEFKGKRTTFFINQDTFTISEMVYKDLFFGEKYTKEILEKRIRFEDYEEMDGVFFPTRWTFFQKGKKQLELRYSEVTFSPEVADAIFERPDQKLDLRYYEEIIN